MNKILKLAWPIWLAIGFTVFFQPDLTNFAQRIGIIKGAPDSGRGLAQSLLDLFLTQPALLILLCSFAFFLGWDARNWKFRFPAWVRRLQLLRFNTRSQLADFLGMTPIGDIPLSANPRHDITDKFSKLHQAYVESSESFRVNFHKKKIIVITSYNPGDGKSTTAFSLAKSLSSSGKKVLLIEGDMIRPSLFSSIGRDRSNTGLFQIAFNDIDIEDAIFKPSDFDFDFLPSGGLAYYGTQTLSALKNSGFLSEIGSLYDFILIDAPPLTVAVGRIWLELAECAVFCVDPSRAPIHKLRDEADKLIGCQIGVVWTKTGKLGDDKSLYSYSYGYSYSYSSFPPLLEDELKVN